MYDEQNVCTQNGVTQHYSDHSIESDLEQIYTISFRAFTVMKNYK